MALMPESSVVLRVIGMIGYTAIGAAVVRVPGVHVTCVATVVSRCALRHRGDERHRHHLEDDEKSR